MENIIKLIVPLVVTLISNIIWVICTIKSKSRTEKIQILKEAIMQIMQDAEQFSNYSAEEKKQYVMTRAIDYLNQNNIRYKENKINSLIEKFIDFSNTVNVKKKGTIKK